MATKAAVKGKNKEKKAKCMSYQVRGPAWKAGNLKGEALSPVSQRSGLNSLASGPQTRVSLPMVQGLHKKNSPFLISTPSISHQEK